jgi:hypothetical protein
MAKDAEFVVFRLKKSEAKNYPVKEIISGRFKFMEHFVYSKRQVTNLFPVNKNLQIVNKRTI